MSQPCLTSINVYVLSSGRFAVLIMHVIVLCSYPVFNQYVPVYIFILGSTHKKQFDAHGNNDVDRERTAGRFPNSGKVAQGSER